MITEANGRADQLLGILSPRQELKTTIASAIASNISPTPPYEIRDVAFPDGSGRTELADLLRHQGELVRPAPLSGLSPDPKDDKFISCALAARADFIVTGNKRDFPVEQLETTKVVSAGNS